MGDDDDLSTAGRAGGVAGWHGGERRQGDRRSRSGSGGGDVTRGSDRRQSQFCHVCGKKFQPTATQKRICPACRGSALRMGQPAGRWGGV